MRGLVLSISPAPTEHHARLEGRAAIARRESATRVPQLSLRNSNNSARAMVEAPPSSALSGLEFRGSVTGIPAKSRHS
jgi:hypothetical protein